jgi:hypothetical protein
VMTPFVIFCLLAAAGCVVWYRRRKKKSSSAPAGAARLYLLIHDGGSYVLHDAARDNGCFVVDGVEYPNSSCRPVELATDSSLLVYVFAAEPIALTTHQQLMRHRSAVIKGHLFKGGGDMTRTINLVAAGAVVACALFVYMSVSSLNSANVQQQVILEKIDKWTQSPLVLQK